ncbi:MAG: NfeD family protein [Sedimentisphaerales bacterium]|jgi:membrane protein implicated in regulation of membrane protease activity
MNLDAIKDYLRPEIIWFLVGLVLLILEFAMPGLIIGFFGVGAWIVACVCLINDIGVNTQLALFIGSSVLSLLFLRRWLKGVFLGHEGSRQDLTHDLEEFVGERAVVKKKILPKLGGKVEFHGTHWEAQADEEIAEGTVVEIVEKSNITLKVKAV